MQQMISPELGRDGPETFCKHPCNCCRKGGKERQKSHGQKYENSNNNNNCSNHQRGSLQSIEEEDVYNYYKPIKGYDMPGKYQHLHGQSIGSRVQVQRPQRRSAAAMNIYMSDFREAHPTFRVQRPDNAIVRDILARKYADPPPQAPDQGGFLAQADREIAMGALSRLEKPAGHHTVANKVGGGYHHGSDDGYTDDYGSEDEDIKIKRKVYNTAVRNQRATNAAVAQRGFPRLKRTRAAQAASRNGQQSALPSYLLTPSECPSIAGHYVPTEAEIRNGGRLPARKADLKNLRSPEGSNDAGSFAGGVTKENIMSPKAKGSDRTNSTKYDKVDVPSINLAAVKEPAAESPATEAEAEKSSFGGSSASSSSSSASKSDAKGSSPSASKSSGSGSSDISNSKTSDKSSYSGSPSGSSDSGSVSGSYSGSGSGSYSGSGSGSYSSSGSSVSEKEAQVTKGKAVSAAMYTLIEVKVNKARLLKRTKDQGTKRDPRRMIAPKRVEVDPTKPAALRRRARRRAAVVSADKCTDDDTGRRRRKKAEVMTDTEDAEDESKKKLLHFSDKREPTYTRRRRRKQPLTTNDNYVVPKAVYTHMDISFFNNCEY